MLMDEKALERKLKAQEEAAQRLARATDADAANQHLFEEFKRPPQPGEAPKPRGLNAQGYQFPPQAGPPPMTKENLAKGVALPPSGNIVPPMPPASELVTKETLFEEYQRPGLKEEPRTGKGLRSHQQPKTAKEILAAYEPPTPQVFTGKRDPAATPAPLPQAPAPIIQPAKVTPMPCAPPQAAGATAESDAAHLDAEADLASAPELTMSHSRSHGPTKVQTTHDPFAEMPNLPGKAAKPTPGKGSPEPHVSDAPPVAPGDDGPRIALVQADFNYGITTRMAEVVRECAAQLGCDVVQHVHVGGVFDVPLAAKLLARRGDVDAVIAVGCVIQGETGHDQLIATEAARKLADLSYESEKPIGLAITGPRMTRAAAEARTESVPRHAVEAIVKQWRALKAIGAARVLH